MDLQDFLSEREIFVLRNHPTITYKAIGEQLGVTPERVRQIKVNANIKIRKEKRRELQNQKGERPITLTIKRKELQLIIRGLSEYSWELTRQKYRKKSPTDKNIDPDIQPADELISKLQGILDQQQNNLQN